MNKQTAVSRTRRAVVIIVAALVLLTLLMLDLANRGLAWRVFYNLVGEEDPIAQVIGMTHWAGRWFRAQPETDLYTPVDHVGMSPFGINVFLEQEVEITKREQILQMISDAGFVWLRQEFPWEDIEIHGPGDFTDRRNDMDGDGEPDTISSWDKYDNIVDLVEKYDLRLQVRLSNPPSWTHSNPEIGTFAPPDNLQDYVNFASAVASRYKGRIFHYQIWNEPNIYPEWGNQDVNPEGYTEMLCRTYAALKEIDPEIVVVSGAMAPTNAMGGRNLNDFIYLQRMLDAGGGECFDVLAMQGYGLNSGPTDRRMRPQTINFSRPLYIRDLMVKNGYANKPIWISEAAWNPVPTEEEIPDIVSRYTYGRVTEDQAARYIVGAYERQQQEWPYVGVMFYWFFKRPADYERNQSFYYFRMAEPDFTPLPVYHAMVDYTQNLVPTLYRGVHQEDHWAIAYPDDGNAIEAEIAEFDEAMQTQTVTFTVHGTELAVRWQGGDTINVYRDDELVNTLSSDDSSTYTDAGWHELRLRLSWVATTHDIRIEAAEDTMLFDAVTVFDNTVRDIAVLSGGSLLIILLLVGGFFAINQRNNAPTVQ